MEAVEILKRLMGHGMSKTGALAMLGNMEAESSLNPGNLQDSYAKAWGVSDAEYCDLVNAGKATHNGKMFWDDGAGFGLCQWTSSDRKRGLYAVGCEQWGVPIEDAEVQIWYACYELRTQYAGLWAYLCSDGCDLMTAVSRICKEYERPAINNVQFRYERARRAEANMAIPNEKPTAPSDGDAADYRVEIAEVLEHLAAILRKAAGE